MAKILNGIKGVMRITIRMIVEAIHRLVINIFDTLVGFLNWPEKKLRIKILILKEPSNRPVLSQSDLDTAIAFAKISLKKNFNVKLIPIGQEQFVEVLNKIPGKKTLYTKGGTGALAEEFKTTGSFFASNLCGSFYPVTAFVVIDIIGATGCSLGPLTDYITLDRDGAKSNSTLVHEIAHACGLWHVSERANLLYRNKNRGDEVKWWQKNLFRGSRHVTYW